MTRPAMTGAAVGCAMMLSSAGAAEIKVISSNALRIR
jgi:hypothetical protein